MDTRRRTCRRMTGRASHGSHEVGNRSGAFALWKAGRVDRLAQLTGRLPAMVDDLAALVAVESPSEDLVACGAVAEAAGALGERLLGARPDIVVVDGRPHVRWRFGSAGRVLLVGHLDTVWP